MFTKESRAVLVTMAVVGVLLACVGTAGAAGGEGDWLDEAAGLVERFEKVSTADIPPYMRQHEYLKLLDEVSKFAQAPTPDAQERKGRKTFGLLLEGRIQEQLGNGVGAVRSWQAHRQERDAMPEADRAALAPLLERTEGAAKAGAPRICEVQVRGKEVRVRAVGYPLVALLAKLEEATGEKIEFIPPEGVLRERMEEAMGDRIQVEPELSGLVDYVHTDWKALRHSLGPLVRRLGLYNDSKDGLGVGIFDPLYMASLSERAGTLAPRPRPTAPDVGVRTGYVIVNGHYVPPPYQVELRTVDDRARVYVNGLPVGQGYKLKDVVHPRKVIELPEDGQFTNSTPLCIYATERYYKDSGELGKPEARKRLIAFLETQRIVKSFEVHEDDRGFRLTLQDGQRHSVRFVGTGRGGRGEGSTVSGPNQYRDQAMKKAEKLKTSIEETLRSNGLWLISGKGITAGWKGQQAREKLLAICTSVQEGVRAKDQLAAAVFNLQTPGTSDWAWEVFLNLRHRELWQRLRNEEFE